VTASHTYSEAGTYTVTLTVTDDDGATDTATKEVTVEAPAAGDLAVDEFDRTVSNGWGSATTGGAWTLSGTASHFSVSGGKGVISTNAGLTRMAYLNGVSSTSTDLTSVFSIDALPTGGSNFVSFIARRVGSSDYQARLSIAATGTVQLQLRRGDTTMTSANISGLTLAAFGTSPTTIRAKVWKVGTTEPANWQASTTDSTAALQSAGGVGVGLYVGSGVSNTPQTVRIASLNAVPVP
jgi:PKD repeat protein